MENMNHKYYNPEIHKASFVLPEFARKVNVEKKKLLFIHKFSYLQRLTQCLLDYDRHSVKHDQQRQTTMFILYLALRPQINNLVLWLLHLLNTVQHHWRVVAFMAGGNNNQWVRTCWVTELFHSTVSFLPVLHTLSVNLFFWWFFHPNSEIVLSAFCD